jgi:protease-4
MTQQNVTVPVARVLEAVRAGRVRQAAPLLLELDLTGGLLPAQPPDLAGRLQSRGTPTLPGVVRALGEAAQDPQVQGLVAKIGGTSLRLADAQELAAAVQGLRARGKRTWAWAESFGEFGPGTAGYLLATAFDEIWLQPSGDLGLTGVAIESVFLRGALDKLGVEPQLGQRHEYKNAADVFLRSEYTPAHHEAYERLAVSSFDAVVGAVAAARGLAPDVVRELADRAPLPAADALAAGLVDRLGYRHEVYAAARAGAVGPGDRQPDQEPEGEARLRYVTAYSRHRAPHEAIRERVAQRGQQVVALVHAVGEIRLGRSGRGLRGPALGSDTLTAALRAAGRDDGVGAVVLRVDSPGGSYVASDAVWAAVREVRAAGTPVVVSMGAVAASGGYFVAAPADAVLALPSTLTGSIGVLGGKPVVADLLTRLGIGTGAVTAGRNARMFSTRARFSDEQWDRVQASLDRIYDDFVGKVAAGRGMTREAVHEIARGRVWTGADALERGLVDELGGLERAADVARERAGLPAEAPLRPYPHVPLVRRLRPARSSDDLAAAAAAGLPAVSGPDGLLAHALGLAPGAVLLMPPVRLSA